MNQLSVAVVNCRCSSSLASVEQWISCPWQCLHVPKIWPASLWCSSSYSCPSHSSVTSSLVHRLSHTAASRWLCKWEIFDLSQQCYESPALSSMKHNYIIDTYYYTYYRLPIHIMYSVFIKAVYFHLLALVQHTTFILIKFCLKKCVQTWSCHIVDYNVLL